LRGFFVKGFKDVSEDFIIYTSMYREPMKFFEHWRDADIPRSFGYKPCSGILNDLKFVKNCL
jgi:hypothetical protein